MFLKSGFLYIDTVSIIPPFFEIMFFPDVFPLNINELVTYIQASGMCKILTIMYLNKCSILLFGVSMRVAKPRAFWRRAGFKSTQPSNMKAFLKIKNFINWIFLVFCGFLHIVRSFNQVEISMWRWCWFAYCPLCPVTASSCGGFFLLPLVGSGCTKDIFKAPLLTPRCNLDRRSPCRRQGRSVCFKSYLLS